MPAEIYWRRRLLVLAVVIALAWVLLRFTSGDDSPSSNPTAVATTPATTVVPVAAPVNGPVDVSLVSASRACDPEKIRITPTVNAGQFTKAPIAVGLVISSTETGACTLTAKDADLLVVISANKIAIWDSTVCKTSLLTDPVAISPRWASLVTASWSGRGSGANCSSKQGYATPGKYVLQAGTLGGEPGKTTFTLKAKPVPKPTRTTPTPKAKGTTKPPD